MQRLPSIGQRGHPPNGKTFANDTSSRGLTYKIYKNTRKETTIKQATELKTRNISKNEVLNSRIANI